jgi:hypothetical protein
MDGEDRSQLTGRVAPPGVGGRGSEVGALSEAATSDSGPPASGKGSPTPGAANTELPADTLVGEHIPLPPVLPPVTFLDRELRLAGRALPLRRLVWAFLAGLTLLTLSVGLALGMSERGAGRVSEVLSYTGTPERSPVPVAVATVLTVAPQSGSPTASPTESPQPPSPSSTPDPTATGTPLPSATSIPVPTGTPVPTHAPDPVPASLRSEATQHPEGTRGAATAGPRPGLTGSYFYAQQTLHSVAEFGWAFARFGGVGGVGYPLTELFVERSEVDGRWYWVQYFEKAVIEYHSAPTWSEAYQLMRLGAWRMAQKYPGGTPPARPLPARGSYTFPETGHTVPSSFLAYWRTRGGLPRFGYPISEAFDEQSDFDGKTYTVQYFERAVMEYHPDQPPPNDVQLAALGLLKLRQSYPAGPHPAAAAPLPTPTSTAVPTARPTLNPRPTLTPDVVATARTSANATRTSEASERTDAQARGTATARAGAAATATEVQRRLETCAVGAPEGSFGVESARLAISCTVEYRCTLGKMLAGKDARWIVLEIKVANKGAAPLHLDPADFTLVSTMGFGLPPDGHQNLLRRPLALASLGSDIPAGSSVEGELAFYSAEDFVPARLLWQVPDGPVAVELAAHE